MAELLVRVVDKVNRDDPYLDVRLTKRGDVIEVRPDGWWWGNKELQSLDWRIFRVPDLSVEEASALLSEEPATSDPPSPMLQRRAFKLDLDADPALAAFEAETRVDTPYEIDLARKDVEGRPVESKDTIIARRANKLDTTAKVIQDVTIRKPSLPDPKVLGDDPRVIG